HLRAETDPKERLSLAQRHLDPVDFVAHELVRIVGTHRAAEDDGADVVGERIGERIAVARAPDIHGDAARLEVMADPSGGRMLLMEDDQDGLRLRRPHGASRMAFLSTRLVRRRRTSCECATASRTKRRGNSRVMIVTALLATPGTTTRRPRIKPS